MTHPFSIEALGTSHSRNTFDCGVAALNRYLHELVGQDIRRNLSKCFVVCPAATNDVAGYYTLAAAELSVGRLPPEMTRKMPRYPTVPTVKIGRLAVDVRFRGRGLGALLVANAFGQVTGSDIGAFAIVVDAKDDTAADFYRRLGFAGSADDPFLLYLPLSTWAKLRT